MTRGHGDDEKRPDEPTPDTDGVDLGADWLMSQLDDTGVQETIDESETERVDEAPPSRKWLRRRRRRGAASDESAADASVDEEHDGESWSLAAEADAESEDTSTQLFDVVADRAAEDIAPGSTSDIPAEAVESDPADVPTRAMPPVVPPTSPVIPATPPATPPSEARAPNVPTPTDEPFTWNLTPNDEPDPLLAVSEDEPAAEPVDEPVSRESVDDDAPTQAFDPFADHEPEPLSPGEAAVAGAFATPGAFDRLYEEATLSNLEDDEDADRTSSADDDAADESADVPFAPVAAGAAAAAASDESGDVDADDDVGATEQTAEEFAPKAAEEAPKPDLGILDLFGKSKQDAQAPETDVTPTPAAEAPPASGRTEPETSDRLKALFESTATAPVVAAAQRSETAEPARRVAPSTASSSAGASALRKSGESGRGTDLRNLKPLTLAGLAVAAVVILGALFWVGTLIPGLVSSPAAEPTETSTPTPTVSIPAEGTLPPGTYAWDQLRGGECLADYTSPWEEEFTVVACDEDHAAQVVKVGAITDDKGASFPGQDELASQIYLLCSAPDVLNLEAAAAYSDVQVQGSYPVNEEQWNDGQRSYFCFVNRSSGDPLNGSLVPTAE